MIFLVRHAKAGHRRDDLRDEQADDSKRPLSSAGEQQALLLVDSLLTAGAGEPLLSSPFTRCVQTLEPLAEHLGIKVEPDDRLAENQPFPAVIDLIAELAPGAVLCSHGDVIPAVIDGLRRRGCAIVDEPNWKKASVWVLERNDAGAVVHATSWPPPVSRR